MSWFGGEGSGTDDGLAAGLLSSVWFDPEDPDSFFNWHESRGISRQALENIYRNPDSKVRELEALYRKAGINIQDLRDLLDESADSVTLEAVFAANKKRLAAKPRKRGTWFLVKTAVSAIAVAGGLLLIAVPFLRSCQ